MRMQDKTANNPIPEGHITLKEASQISGYAPDYVGQLIRKGKLYGRQVYLNVAWVTTEDSLREYMLKDPRSRQGGDAEPAISDLWRRMENAFLSDVRLMRVAQYMIYGFIGLLLLFSVFLFYIFSVRLDARLNERALRNLETTIEP